MTEETYSYIDEGNNSVLIRETNLVDDRGDIVGCKITPVITREEFIKCFYAWIVDGGLLRSEIKSYLNNPD